MNAITAFSKCIQLIVRGSDVINEIDALWERRELDGLKTASVASRTTLLFLSIAEIACGLTNQTLSSTARFTKVGEVLVRAAIDTPIQAFEAFDTIMNGNTDGLTKIRIIEKKIFGPFAGLIRATAEADLQQQQYYLSLPKQEQDKIQIPIFEYDWITEMNTVVGYKPFDREASERSVTGLEKAIPILNIFETAFELNAGSKIIGISQTAFDMLTQRTIARRDCRARTVAPANDPVVPVAPIRQPVLLMEEHDISHLLLKDSIPIELEEDETLKQFICAITHCPIRYIVADPTTGNRTYYECSAIQSWLSRHPTSPVTRALLLPSQLTPCIAIQTIIDQRLELYAQKIREAIVRIDQEPINQGEIDDAIAQVQV